MIKLKQFLAIVLAVISGCIYAQLPAPAYVGSAKFSAKGSGATGNPTINFTLPNGITNKNRIMVITMSGERYNPSGTNLFTNNGANDIYDAISYWNTVVNGIAATAVGGYHQNLNSSTNSTTILQVWNGMAYTYKIPDNTTGTVSITFPNLGTPQTANDEISFIISVYENVKSLQYIFAPFDIGASSSVSALTAPLGRTTAEIMYMVHGGITQQTNLSLSTGWTVDQTNRIDNVTTNAASVAPNEHDGIAHIVGHRNAIVGNPTVTISRSGTGNVVNGLGVFNALMPFASPGISGNVYRDTTGSSTIEGTATNAGGTYVNVINSTNNLVYSAAVNITTGAFTIPTGFVMEGDTYRLELSKNTAFIGSAAPLKELPANWLTVGESATGTSPFTSDGANNGTINLTIGTTNVTGLRYGINSCTAGSSSPAINATTQYSNVLFSYTIPCGSLTANLTTLTASNTPPGNTITWHTGAAATDANKVTATAISGTVKLYAAFYDSTGPCYSPTREVTVNAPICAVNDDYSSTPIIAGVGGTLPSIFNNDTYNGNNIALLPPNSVQFLYELWTPSNAIVDLAGNGSVTIPATVPPGTYTYIYKICDKDPDAITGASCSTASVTFVVAVDSDGDGVADTSDLDDDNDGILDTLEMYCDQTTPPNGVFPATNSPATAPAFTNQLLFFDWSGVTLSNASPSATRSVVFNGITYTATVSGYNSTANSTMIANDILTWNGPSQMIGRYYNVNGTNFKEVFFTPSNVTSTNNFNFKITATKGSVIYPVDIVVFDSETSNNFLSTEKVKYVTSGSNFSLLEKTGTGSIPGNITGEGTNTLTYLLTENTNVNALYVTSGYDFTINASVEMTNLSQQAIGFAVRVFCDNDNDGVPSYLDLDSDGDGCSDAIEGESAFTASNLVNSGMPGGNSGGSYTGTSTTPVTQNLGNTVGSTATTIGVPTIAGAGQTIGDSQNGAVSSQCSSTCYKPGILDTANTYPTKHGITALGRAGAESENWPMVRQSAWTVLEAKTKGFVLNRVKFNASNLPVAADGTTLVITSPIEGMMVYDTTNNCLKVYTSNDGGTTYAWHCMATQTCPQ
ncbi:CshA/CshB family fibrillar adhesin-related protein [Chryseobacterium aahli]|uniref:CshA/CshB family fibrillar adhesin-related protein n=1 Tax=Chryseobacterium aahli TaxID=1278643 RepID=UPI001F60154B|nr:CshA/CshB family fibrillar adhesin-related protein [Chryseobacterium aahli]